ncbi:MAG: NUDIX domain-containing protein [Patescibacteria group bacterium]
MKNNIQIVDSNDNIISFKKREDVDYKKDIYRVTGLWVTNSQDEVLIAKRKSTKDKDPGKWGPAVAGTVEQNETYESNIKKESEEEIGLRNLEFKIGLKRRIYKPRNYFVQWFLVKIDKNLDEFKIQEEEVEQLSWISEVKLRKDTEKNPEKYIPSMPGIINLFIPIK